MTYLKSLLCLCIAFCIVSCTDDQSLDQNDSTDELIVELTIDDLTNEDLLNMTNAELEEVIEQLARVSETSKVTTPCDPEIYTTVFTSEEDFNENCDCDEIPDLNGSGTLTMIDVVLVIKLINIYGGGDSSISIEDFQNIKNVQPTRDWNGDGDVNDEDTDWVSTMVSTIVQEPGLEAELNCDDLACYFAAASRSYCVEEEPPVEYCDHEYVYSAFMNEDDFNSNCNCDYILDFNGGGIGQFDVWFITKILNVYGGGDTELSIDDINNILTSTPEFDFNKDGEVDNLDNAYVHNLIITRLYNVPQGEDVVIDCSTIACYQAAQVQRYCD